MPKASIILPCFNVEKYLSRSIESALAQTFFDFELLIIIDGSPDNSKMIADKYAKQDSRIKVYEKENGGLSDARNFGLERATSDYIYFMDSDDWIEPDLLEDNIKRMTVEDLDFIIFGYFQDDENESGEIIKRTLVYPLLKKIKKKGGGKLDLHHIGLLGYAWNKIYSRNFLHSNNLFFEKGTSLVEDILFNTQVYLNSSTIYFNTKAYYHYLNRPVVTLMKSFHKDSYLLKVRKNKSLEIFCNVWGIENQDEILYDSLLLGLKYCLNNLYESKVARDEKFKLLHYMGTHPRTIEILYCRSAKTFKDRLLLFFLRYRIYFFFNSLMKLR